MNLLQQTADIPARNLHRVLAVKACLADRQIADHLLEKFNRHIAKGISADHLTDFLCGMGMGNQLLIGRNIRAEIAGIEERRRTDTHMNFFCPCFFHHGDDIGDRGSPDDGVIHEDNPFASDHRFQDAQLDFDTGFPFLLARLDESSADIAVFVEGKSKGMPDASEYPLAAVSPESGTPTTRSASTG